MAVAVQPQTLDLMEAILQLVNLGEKDPLTIYRKLEERHGTEWLATALFQYRGQIIPEIARHVLGNERRQAVETIATVARSERKVSKREVKLAAVFVPGEGYKKVGELTADD